MLNDSPFETFQIEITWFPSGMLLALQQSNTQSIVIFYNMFRSMVFYRKKRADIVFFILLIFYSSVLFRSTTNLLVYIKHQCNFIFHFMQYTIFPFPQYVLQCFTPFLFSNSIPSNLEINSMQIIYHIIVWKITEFVGVYYCIIASCCISIDLLHFR